MKFGPAPRKNNRNLKMYKINGINVQATSKKEATKIVESFNKKEDECQKKPPK